MRKNMGIIDRIIRSIVGIALIGVGVITGLWFLYIIAGILLLTSLIGVCPLYIPFGIRTFMGKEKEVLSNDKDP